MKEIVERIVDYRTCFKAVDGKAFSTKEACLEHERALNIEAVKKMVEKMPHFSSSPEWIDPDYSWEWYLVSSQEELDAIRTVLYNTDATAHEYEAVSFPCWLAFSFDADGYGQVEGNLEQVFDRLQVFEYEVNKWIMRIEGGKG